MAFKVDVVKVKVDGKVGFAVRYSFCPGSDEMWESITHRMVFEDIRKANALCDKVRKAGGAKDWSHWVWEAQGPCTPYARLKVRSTARFEFIPGIAPTVWVD